MQEANFFDDIKNSTEIISMASQLNSKIENFNNLKERIQTDLELLEIVDTKEIANLEEIMEKLEIEVFLNSEYDALNCYIEIHPGAGGTEAQDWAEMLLRMYQRFCDKYDYKYEEIYFQKGDEAGIKSATIKITGASAFGFLKNESGIHRLVRISPFDANKRRHTSFASVNVTPEFKKQTNIEINENDLKIDVYHSSGAGGQSVNTSNSAVRITHLPTKIVVAVQNERSQLKNKEIALEILKSKLYALELAKSEDKIKGFKNVESIDFGSQIRSYILEPYKLVKDHRTGFELSSPEKVLDGDIMELLEFNLKNIKE